MNKALIVVDMQKAYFVNHDLKKRQTELVSKCNELIKAARGHNAPVIMLKTLHHNNRSSWTLNMLDDDKGYLFYGDESSDYLDGLDIKDKIEIIKTRDSGFWKTALLTELRNCRIVYVVICGVSTHSCVALTAIDAYNSNIRVELAVQSIASHDEKYHKIMLDMLHQEYRMALRNNNDIVWNL